MADPALKPYNLAGLATLSFCIALALPTTSHDLIFTVCSPPLFTEERSAGTKLSRKGGIGTRGSGAARQASARNARGEEGRAEEVPGLV